MALRLVLFAAAMAIAGGGVYCRPRVAQLLPYNDLDRR
jgi:hypothetical protein